MHTEAGTPSPHRAEAAQAQPAWPPAPARPTRLKPPGATPSLPPLATPRPSLTPPSARRFLGRAGPAPRLCEAHGAAGRAAAGVGAGAWLVFLCALYRPLPPQTPAPPSALYRPHTPPHAPLAASPPAPAPPSQEHGGTAGAGAEWGGAVGAAEEESGAVGGGVRGDGGAGLWRTERRALGEEEGLRSRHVPLSAVDFHTHPQVDPRLRVLKGT